MELLSNIVSQPKTSIAGLLIGIATVAGVLSQQGVTLGTAGKGTMVALIGGIAAALLGLISQDPGASQRSSAGPALGSSSGAGSAQKLGVLVLCSIVLMGSMIGCSAAAVAQDIVNFTPPLESAIATVDTTASLLLPADAPLFALVTAGLDAAINELDAQAKAYLANPNAGVLAALQNAAVTAQQTVNASLLKAAGIKDSASQTHALAAINGVGTIVTAILGLVQSISSKSQVAQMAARSPIKLAQVRQLLDERQMAEVAQSYGITPDVFLAREAAAGF